MTNLRAYLAVTMAAFALAFGATVVDAGGWDEFGRCLARNGAIFYGASWCPHCRAQRQTLGDAMAHVHYVECAVNGERAKSAPECTSADVNSYPTWVFADGSRAHGEQSPSRLAMKTGCDLPEGSPGASDPAAHTHRGPKIIEVPN